MFKKVFLVSLAAILVLAASLSCQAEEAQYNDVTYVYMLNNALYAISSSDDAGESMVVLDTASVWRQADDLAGFSLVGDRLLVYGEADMDTGIITKLFCRLPWSAGGVNLWSLIMFSMSGEQTYQAFAEKYIDENGDLRPGISFPSYAFTLYGVTGEDLVFELVRIGSWKLASGEGDSSMREFIEMLQK